jgi:hypothetical protein
MAMAENGFFQPLVAVFGLLKRGSSLVTWALLIALAMATRVLALAMATGVKAKYGASGLVLEQMGLTLAAVFVGAMLAFFLARMLVAVRVGRVRPLYGPFIGLFIARFFIDRIITGIGRVFILLNGRSSFMMTYGSMLLGSLGAILTFPFLVRILTAGAGAREPRFGGTMTFAFDEGRFAYVRYAICAIVFPILMVYTFANILPSGNQANDLPGNFLQSVITGTGTLLEYLLAVVVAQWTLPSEQGLAETFA